MKILYQSPSLIPSQTANSVHVMSVADELGRMGHEVKLFVLRGSLGGIESDYEYYGVDRSFQINKVSSASRFGKVKFLFGSLGGAIKFKPDLVITRFPLGAYLFMCFGFQVVLDAHHPVWVGSSWKKILYKVFSKNKNLKKITTNSNSLKEIFYGSGMKPRCQICVAHNGSKIYPLHEKMELKNKQATNVGYLGSVYRGRGIDLVFKIAEKLSECNFHIAGGSAKEIEELKAENDVPSNVHFYGYIDPAKSYLFRNSCDILIAPYHRKGVMVSDGKEDSSQYMNPIKIIEYMSSGKAIIASNLPPIREVLNDEIAILANPDKVNEWVEAIELFKKDKGYMVRVGKKAFDTFLENYTWKDRALKIIEDLEGV